MTRIIALILALLMLLPPAPRCRIDVDWHAPVNRERR